MRRSHYFAPTLKEIPSDAAAISHQLMLRAGLVRTLAAGIYSYLPLGWAAARKASQIIREEMERIGGRNSCCQLSIPSRCGMRQGARRTSARRCSGLLTARGMSTAWPRRMRKSSARPRGVKYDHGVTCLRSGSRSRRSFATNPAPVAACCVCVSFIMKDSYSLDRDEAGLDISYDLHRQAYERIFQRCGLVYFIVGASSGLMGGAHRKSSCSSRTLVRITSSAATGADMPLISRLQHPPSIRFKAGSVVPLTEVSTPGKRTVEEVSRFLQVPPGRLVKTLIYVSPTGPVMALIAGDDELSESKLTKAVNGLVRPAQPEEVREWMNARRRFPRPAWRSYRCKSSPIRGLKTQPV